MAKKKDRGEAKTTKATEVKRILEEHAAKQQKRADEWQKVLEFLRQYAHTLEIFSRQLDRIQKNVDTALALQKLKNRKATDSVALH
jgi:hypothetical protein